MKKIFLVLIVIFNAIDSYSQEYIKLSGYVKDSASNEAIIGATILNPINGKGTVTNNYGFFGINIPKKSPEIQVSYVGYTNKHVKFHNNADTVVNIMLARKAALSEIVITGNTNLVLLSAQTSMERITSETVNSLPVIMGEPDLLRTIQLLPGVSMGTESSLGYNVRGGSSDQNLILIDGVPVYSGYHMYGLFSIINTDAINDAKLYKGGFPARFGGRLSSVLDIQMRDGNSNNYSGELSLGPIASKFTLEGPINKEKTSFIITGRRSLTDILPAFLYNGSSVSDHTGLDKISRDMNLTSYYFYDINSKINHTFSNRDRLFINFYRGRDDYDMNRNIVYPKSYNYIKYWGNALASVRWAHIFRNSLCANFTLYYTSYNYLTQEDNINKSGSADKYLISYQSKIFDYAGKADLVYSYNNHAVKFGAQFARQIIFPGVSAFSAHTGSLIDTTYNFEKRTNVLNAFIEDDVEVTHKLKINFGIHFNGYFVDNTVYPSLQPRFSCNYRLSESKSVKASYSRMVQNLHQLSQTTLGSADDLWMPSTKQVKPSYSDIFVVGYSQSVHSQITFTFELFRKNLYNLVMYKEGASYMVDKTDWQDKVETGTGKSYGIELSFKKEEGKTTGWIAYTLSKSLLTFENINSGKEFPFTYDRTHNISIVLMQKLGRKFDISADWVYSTGQATTLATSMVITEVAGQYDGFYLYSSVNGFRMPPYHRLDVCLNYNFSLKKFFKKKLSIGAYNVYNRANPYFIKVTPDGTEKGALFGILPYVNFTLKF